MKTWTGSLLFLLVASLVAFALAVAHEKNFHPLRDFAARFRRLPFGRRLAAVVFVGAMWAYASVKPGGAESGQQGAGSGGVTNASPLASWSALGSLKPTTTPGGEASKTGFTRAQDPSANVNPVNLANPVQDIITSTNTTRTLTAADFERGFVMTRIGTDEAFDFTPSPNATLVNDWLAFGAAEDWIYLAMSNWVFQVGTNDVSRLRVFSFGKVVPLIREVDGSIAMNNWFALGPSGCSLADARPSQGSAGAFIATLGIVPEANWPLLGESGRPSQVWYATTPEGSLLITWQNALLGRDTDKPISFQIEFKTDGRFIYRYDLSRLNVDAVTNVLAGASFGGNEWTTNSIPTNVTSMAFHLLSEEDASDQDPDGDGLLTIDELFVYGTDPHNADSDYDGLNDGEEIVRGTDSAVRDSDNDGLVDGSDPDPASATSLDDLDGDGIPDAYENHWFGGTNIVDSADEFGANGFKVGFALASGLNPTNDVDDAFMSTNRIAAWKLTDGFYATGGPQSVATAIYERAFHIARNGGWEQFFLSSKPDRAGAWRLEGLALDWEDSEGESGTTTSSPAGDSLYLPISTNSPATLTVRFRQTASTMSCRTPLYLLAYSPNVEIEDAQRITTSNGVWTVAEIKEATAFPVAIDRAERPCRAALHPQEEAAQLPADGGRFLLLAGGTLQVNAPGVCRLPTIDLAANARSAFRAMSLRASPPSPATNNRYLAFIDPGISYGAGHHGDGSGLGYDSWSGAYSETYEYPLDSGCLWRSFHSDASGGYVCNCSPALSLGFDFGVYPDISTNIVVNGETATGTIAIGGTPIWAGTATHDVSTAGGGGTEQLSDDGCDDCGGCEDGNCDSLEGADLGSLKFRIPLGVPRKGQVSGFAWFMTEAPIAVGIDTLQVLARGDANVTDSTSGGTRTIVCGDNRGRTLVIVSIENGISVTITETASGSLEHTWELTNVNGSYSQIRLRKISRQNNTMSDETYIYDNGDWMRFDGISQSSEELIATGDINGDGYMREERIVRDALDAALSHTISESRRFGSFADAVLRQTYYAEKSWGEDSWNESFASYYTDNDNPRRNGCLRLEWGNARAWRFCAYDTEGRSILTLDQHEGSECPKEFLSELAADAFDSADALAWLQSQAFAAIATVYDYTPLAGDDAAAADVDKVRICSRYLVEDGAVTLIGRAWTRYTHGTSNGYASVTVETTNAGAQDAAIGDSRNAVTVETRYDEDAAGVPLVLRGEVVSSTDADGITTENTYSISGDVLSLTSQMSYMSRPFPVTTHAERCTTYGNTLREWSVHTASGTAFDEKQHLYDEKNRLRSTIYADGSFSTNAYSCCRLLWSQDRTGRKVLRSAMTGEDHLYYAMEEVSLSALPHDNRYIPYEASSSVDSHYRVTQHFMDALGRETNTVLRVARTPGCATNHAYVLNKGWRTSESISYPYGVSDYEISTDRRGNATTTIRRAYADREVTETIETNKTTIATTYRNGSTLLREEWPDKKWKETVTSSSYDANGCRVDIVAITASDHNAVTMRTTYRDFLGRIVREVTPKSDITYTYDGASLRVLTTTDLIFGEATTHLYNDLGEAVGRTKNGVINRTDTDYEVASNVLWRVTTQTEAAGTRSRTLATKERLNGLSDALRSETESWQNGVLALHAHSFFDTTNSVLTEVSESATAGTTTTRSRFGIAYETTTPGGTTSSFFDPYGRVFYTEKDGRSVDWIGRNDYGDVEEYDVFHARGDNVYAEFYGYDSFGNRIVATNALGAMTTSAYDAANRLASSGGAVYPARYGYDTAGRRTGLSTTRDGTLWDTTTWTYDPATSLCSAKTYADGSTVTYTHTPDGKPLRTAYAGDGQWHENSYNAKRELVSTEYSDGEVCVFSYDEFSQEVFTSNGVSSVAFARSTYGQITNETVSVEDETYSLDREFDAHGRLASNDGSIYEYDSAGRLASISNAIAITEYQYSADGLDAGYFITLTNGAVFTRSLTRDAYRRSLITGITNSVNGIAVENFAYAYDALNRPTSRNADTFGYNDRSEVTSATIVGGSQSAATAYYGYDEIGNSTDWTANNLNQYTQF
ncbi:MAG: RHS repeat domain-containing protein, partial [Kiritimatiellia bacterium]